MSEDAPDLVEQLHRAIVEQGARPVLPQEPPTIHYTELPDAKPDSPLYQEWNYYRREVGRLLAEGHEGRFILIKGEAVVGIWDTREEAKDVALEKFLMQPCLIQQVCTREPLLRMPTRFWICPG
jgi:hypothetical protein